VFCTTLRTKGQYSLNFMNQLFFVRQLQCTTQRLKYYFDEGYDSDAGNFYYTEHIYELISVTLISFNS